MDLVFAEGIEAVFRFAVCLMKRNEKKICEMAFDTLLDFLKLSLFELYKVCLALYPSLRHAHHDHMALTPFGDIQDDTPSPESAPLNPVSSAPPTDAQQAGAKLVNELGSSNTPDNSPPTYRAHEFIKDALQVRITPMMLDQYASEWDSICKERNAHNIEIERLRLANSHLSAQVRRLESNIAHINEEVGLTIYYDFFLWICYSTD